MPEASPLTALLADLASGTVTPVAIAGAAQSRADASAAEANAAEAHAGQTYLRRDPAAALAYAAALPNLFPNPAARPPLYGVPVSLKDCFDLTGTVTTCGSTFYAHHNPPATEDSWLAARLLAAGCVITGKTHLHQLAYGITGENHDFGDSVQPRDRTLLTGGSSSGAVASVQEGSALFAIGTDTGGSVRVPAALCGLAGYRASHNLFPEHVCWRGGAHLAQTFDTLGLLFRDLRDGPPLANAIFDVPFASAPTAPRIGFVADAFLHDCDPDVLAAYAAMKLHLIHHGATLTPFDTSFWANTIDIFTTIQASEAAVIHRGHFAHFEPAIADRLTFGASVTPDQLAAMHTRLVAFKATTAAQFAALDFLILPAAPVSRLIAGDDQSGARARILRYTSPISMPGLPTITLSGELLSPDFFGTGVQLVAPPLHDATLLAFAASLAAKPSQAC